MEDISKTTVSVLLILVVLISVIGTWVVMNTLIQIDRQPVTEITQSQGSGNLRLTISKPEEVKSDTSQGNVRLVVLKPGK